MDPNANNNQLPQQPVQPIQPVETIQQPVATNQEQNTSQASQSASVTQPVAPQNYSTTQSYQSEHHTGKSLLKAFIILIIIIAAVVGLVYAGMMFMGQQKPVAQTNNANVFVEPTVTQVTPAETMPANLNDTTDAALTKDSATIEKDLNQLQEDLNNVDQSLKDQQTNLN